MQLTEERKFVLSLRRSDMTQCLNNAEAESHIHGISIHDTNAYAQLIAVQKIFRSMAPAARPQLSVAQHLALIREEISVLTLENLQAYFYR